MDSITKYIPVKKLTRRQLAKKLIFWQIVLISLLLNLSLAHQIYDVRCKTNNEIQGWFVRAEVCDNIATNQADSQELAREQMIQNNPEYFK